MATSNSRLNLENSTRVYVITHFLRQVTTTMADTTKTATIMAAMVRKIMSRSNPIVVNPVGATDTPSVMGGVDSVGRVVMPWTRM